MRILYQQTKRSSISEEHPVIAIFIRLLGIEKLRRITHEIINADGEIAHIRIPHNFGHVFSAVFLPAQHRWCRFIKDTERKLLGLFERNITDFTVIFGTIFNSRSGAI